MAAGYEAGDRVLVTLPGTVTNAFSAHDQGLTVTFDDTYLGGRTFGHGSVLRGEVSFEKVVEYIEDGDPIRAVIEGKYVGPSGSYSYGEQPPGGEWCSHEGDKVTIEKAGA
jgi:hypothetical protein